MRAVRCPSTARPTSLATHAPTPPRPRQAARYVNFRVGVLFAHNTTHLLSNAAACVAASGTCTSDRVNPLYRPIIDLPGQRFLLVGDLSYELFAQATGEF